MQCPKCQRESSSETECTFCGIVFDKYRLRLKAEEMKAASIVEPQLLRSSTGGLNKRYSRAGWIGIIKSIGKILLALLSLSIVAILVIYVANRSQRSEKRELGSIFWSAVLKGEDANVIKSINKGADVNMRDENGCTPLFFASMNGYQSTVKILLDHQADINASCNNGVSALLMASGRGHMSIIQLLLDRGADVKKKSREGYNALIYAMTSGDTSIIQSLIAHGAEVNYRFVFNQTPLIYATTTGKTPIVQMLLESGADITAADDNGYSALMHAIKINKEDMVQLLINKGALVNDRARDGYTTLRYAKSLGNEKIVQMIIAAGAIEQKDPALETILQDREKVSKVTNAFIAEGWELFADQTGVQYFVKPTKRIIEDDVYEVSIREYFVAANEIFQTELQMNCVQQRYSHISTGQIDLTGYMVRNIPIDSYVLADKGRVQKGSAMQILYQRLCTENK